MRIKNRYSARESSHLNEKITLYLGFVDSVNNCYSNEICLEAPGFSDIDFNFYEELENRGLKICYINILD